MLLGLRFPETNQGRNGNDEKFKELIVSPIRNEIAKASGTDETAGARGPGGFDDWVERPSLF
jgi:hypothetical protein